ncbi:tail fiber domain-containing protein [Filimonas effusa]|nr:tail fiber domain-containing protein [Filimonas effusa]
MDFIKIDTSGRLFYKCVLMAAGFFFACVATGQQLKLGNNVTRFDSSAALEIESQKQTLLLPRIKDTTMMVKTMKDGSMIYFENQPASGLNKGLYLRSNGAWNWMTPEGVGNEWSIWGNSGLANGSFLGTTDYRPLVLKTNNITRLIIDSAKGYLGLRTSAPVATLHNQGSTLFGVKFLPDLASDGLVGDAVNTVDSFTVLAISQTTVSRNIGLPAPSSAEPGRMVLLINTGTSGFYTKNVTVLAGRALWLIWTGSTWVPTGDGMGQGVSLPPTNSLGTNNFGILSGAAAATSGSGNVAIGLNALNKAGQGIYNIAIGTRAGQELTQTSNNYNIMIGHDAFSRATSSDDQISIGDSALAITQGDTCLAVGNRGLAANTTGNSNVAAGTDALRSMTTGSNNTAVGAQALANASGNSSHNAVMGYRAGYNLATGSFNTALGAYALAGVTTGSYNTALGYYAGYTDGITASNPTVSNATAIGAFAQITNSNTIILGSANPAYASNVGIGIYNPLAKLHVNGDIAATGPYQNTSDGRLKKDIQPITNALDKITALRSVMFNWNQEAARQVKMNTDKRSHYGFIAQEVEKVLPEVVFTANDSMQTKTVAYNDIIPVLTEAIRERQQIIEDLQHNNAKLKQQLLLLKEQKKNIEKMLPVTTK